MVVAKKYLANSSFLFDIKIYIFLRIPIDNARKK